MINKKDLELKLLLRESHIQQLNLKVDKLQQRISKAIEYIKEEQYVEPKELYGLVSADELLNILQGSEYNDS